MLRDNLAGSSSRCSAGGLLSRCTLTGRSHRTIDPLCLENPRPAGAEPTLTENVASPFHAEPRQLNQFVFCVVLSQVSKSQSALHIYPVDRNMESFDLGMNDTAEMQ